MSFECAKALIYLSNHITHHKTTPFQCIIFCRQISRTLALISQNFQSVPSYQNRLYALTDIFALNIHTQTTPLKIKTGRELQFAWPLWKWELEIVNFFVICISATPELSVYCESVKIEKLFPSFL